MIYGRDGIDSQDIVASKVIDRWKRHPVVVVDSEVGCGSKEGGVGALGYFGNAMASIDNGGGSDPGDRNECVKKREEAHESEGGHGGQGINLKSVQRRG